MRRFALQAWLLLLFSKLLIQLVKTNPDATPHIVVVGAGLAGLSATLGALNQNANVTLIEIGRQVGGNSAKAASGINACESDLQKRSGVEDTCALFINDTLKAGQYMNNRQLVQLLAQRSASFVNELPRWGLNLSQLVILAGHSVKRTHRVAPTRGRAVAIGKALVQRYYTMVELAAFRTSANRHFRLLTNTNVTALITTRDGVSGVLVRNVNGSGARTISADAVVLATGGYSNDHTQDSLIMQYASWLKDFPTTNGPHAVGSGIKMARSVGAKLVDMNRLQLHPTGFVDPTNPSARTKFLAPEAFRGFGGILLDQSGRRFANELVQRDTLTAAITTHCKWDPIVRGSVAFLVVNNEVVRKLGQAEFRYYWKVKHFFEDVANGSMLAVHMGVDEQTINRTLYSYNASAAMNYDTFGKTVFPVTFLWDETLYVAKVTPVIHYSMGGIVTDTNMRVINVNGSIIKGLYAAGEVTGGMHGYDRLGGNSLIECLSSGSLAGVNAAVDEARKLHTEVVDKLQYNESSNAFQHTLHKGLAALMFFSILFLTGANYPFMLQ
ncbi:hypothetical protein M514_01220 [Trichuris suis]|uniref:FAD-dependent oxidoreductase 2 FAD-binding domain-containing protein n=1 Tax=Trichuris suis TaxID=68888 RepID=A0A085NMX9_9BILA|nr:hypothetical protein M514_01220 [Trichuris suis]KHJ45842.1 flavocytochrome c [Trichuris suis]